MIGLKRGTVALCCHEKEWEENAAQTIKKLKALFGDAAVDIQHVGSTSIVHIMAKPIIDIAVAVNSFEAGKALIPALENAGVIYSPGNDEPEQMLFVCGDFENDTRSHHIHVVLQNSSEWVNYINFRDYMNANPDEAKRYEQLKQRLMEAYPNDRNAYTEGKAEYIQSILQLARL